MKTMAAAEANRNFSAVLREVARGEHVLVLARGRPVAKISPVHTGASEREVARRVLLARLQGQPLRGQRNWTRDELYDEYTCG